MIFGYDYVVDGKTGKTLAVNRGTGEVTDTIDMTVPVGTYFVTPEQQEENTRKRKAAQERREREERQRWQQAEHNKLGKQYFFIPTNETFDGIAPEMVTRLIYLNTFLDLDKGRLMLTQRTQMTRANLPVVLGVSVSTAKRFWKAASPQYITETESGLTVSRDIFKRGKIRNPKHEQLMKFYFDGIQALYKACDPEQRGRLGILFKLLPFINIEWNLLCKPECVTETDLSSLELLTMGDFCALTGFNVKHLNDLVRSYREITFDVDGHKELFCSIAYDGINKAGAYICINPNVFYSGMFPDRVKVLGALCRL